MQSQCIIHIWTVNNNKKFCTVIPSRLCCMYITHHLSVAGTTLHLCHHITQPQYSIVDRGLQRPYEDNAMIDRRSREQVFLIYEVTLGRGVHYCSGGCTTVLGHPVPGVQWPAMQRGWSLYLHQSKGVCLWHTAWEFLRVWKLKNLIWCVCKESDLKDTFNLIYYITVLYLLSSSLSIFNILKTATLWEVKHFGRKERRKKKGVGVGGLLG